MPQAPVNKVLYAAAAAAVDAAAAAADECDELRALARPLLQRSGVSDSITGAAPRDNCACGALVLFEQHLGINAASVHVPQRSANSSFPSHSCDHTWPHLYRRIVMHAG
jgi:hypothetical protein